MKNCFFSYNYLNNSMMKKESNLSKKTLLGLGLVMIGVNAQAKTNLQYSEPNCHTYNKSDGSCDVCSFKYWKTTSGNCEQVSDSCNTWSEVNGKCTSCYGGYGLNRNGTCTVGGGVDQPIISLPSTNPDCQCYYQNRSCNYCYDGYYLNSRGLCVLLPENCKDVNQTSGKCVDCEQGYFPDNSGVCKLISSIPDDHCQYYEYVNIQTGHWKKAWFLNCSKVCVKCYGGYYLNESSKCQKLPVNCIQANAQGQCLECEAGFQPNQNGDCGIIIGTPVQKCAEYGYMNAFGKIFSKWFFKSKKVCIQCKQGYYLDRYRQCQYLPDKCKKADSNGVCIKCQYGYELDYRTNKCR